jgi:hypothetical protein
MPEERERNMLIKGIEGTPVHCPEDSDVQIMPMRNLMVLAKDVERELGRRTVVCGDYYNWLLEVIGKEYSTKGKIPAIKLFWNMTQQGLKEAKETVEAWASIYRWEAPLLDPGLGYGR